jgi:hypothetical protein
MKTGGTSLISWIQRHYSLEESLVEATTWAEMLAVPAMQLARKKFIRGHFGVSILRLFQGEARVITVLRHPVERVLSHYFHSYNDPNDAHHQLVRASNMTLEAYIRDRRFAAIVENYQTASLGMSLPLGEVLREPSFPDLSLEEQADCVEAAHRFLESATAVGVTDDLDGFMKLLCAQFPFLYDSNLPRLRAQGKRLDVGRDVLEEIEERNAEDLRLYEAARQRYIVLSQRYIGNPPPGRASDDDWSPVYLQTMARMRQQYVYRWSAKESPVGRGWHDAIMEGQQMPAHRWTGPSSESFIDLPLVPGHKYQIEAKILRMVRETPWRVLRVDLNGLKGILRHIPSPSDSLLFYKGVLGPVPASGRVPAARLTIENSELVSFSEVNPADRDELKRGFALVEISASAVNGG